MKNLKKVLALVVALTMVLGTVGFAAYTDVAEDANEYTAVSTLSSLSILTGYEDGSFKPDGDITRAEFATVVCRALGAKVSGSAVTGFTDVPADHWASAYIAYCAGAGIVNGMGDGTFAPSANVTVEQAVKMLVVALGYEPMAAAKGGYPTGYMVVANTNGITEGVATAQTAAATRGAVAQLVYNALDVPMMVQDGFGTQVSFKVADGGENNPAYQSLLTGLDVAKLEGHVAATHIIGETEIGEVNFYIEDAYDHEFFTDYEEVASGYDFEVGEGVNADAYFGYASIIYAKELSRKDWEIIAIMPGEDSETIELGLEDIDTENFDKNGVAYYTDENKYDTKIYKFAEDVEFYLNYVKLNEDRLAVNSDAQAIIDADYDDIEITLIENDGDNRYDIVSAKGYTYDRVETVEADKERFNGSYSFTFDFDDDEKFVSIVDKNGDAMELADFAEDDVITFISKNDETKKAEWIEIINLGQNAVTGTVTEENKEAVYIDGTEYGIAAGAEVKLGDEGTFYLTRTGKIFASEKSASVSGNYAYILATALTKSDWDEEWQIKMLTKDNEIVTYSVRDGFAFNDDDVSYENNADSAATSAGIYLNELSSKADNAFLSNPQKRLVTYKLDSKGLIRELNPVDMSSDYTVSSDADEYEADAQYLYGDLEDDVVIFNIDTNSVNGVFATNLNSLVDGNEYEGWLVTNNVTDESDCLIITKGGSKVDVTQDLAIVAGVTDITVDEGATDAKKVRYFTEADDTVKEIIIVKDPEISVAADDATTYEMVKTGAVMMFTDDGNGTAAAYMVVANTDFSGGSDAFLVNDSAASVIFEDSDEDISIVYGYIDDYTRVSGGQKIEAVVGGETVNLVIKNTTNTYTIVNNSTIEKAKVFVGDWEAADVDKADKLTKDCANFFIAKKVKSTVVDFITASKPYAYK